MAAILPLFLKADLKTLQADRERILKRLRAKRRYQHNRPELTARLQMITLEIMRLENEIEGTRR